MISFNRYINIVSGVGAGAGVRNRELILRVLTQSTAIPPGIVAEFSNPDAVASYFGASSEEYNRALAYFSFISKSIKSPRKISFGRWVGTDIAPMIIGDTVAKKLSDWTGVTPGSLVLTVAGADTTVPAIDTSSAESLTAVASALQTAIRAAGTGVAQLASAVVQYNTNTNQFILTGSTAGSGSITCKVDGSGDVSVLLGWTTSGTVNIPGQPKDSPQQAVAKSAAISTNFGSFLYSPQLATDSTGVAAITDVASWNSAQNNKYMFLLPVVQSDVPAIYAACKGYGGMGVTVKSATMTFDYCDQCPAEILASTDYTAPNGVQGYMYYQFDTRNPTVSDDTVADLMDHNRANYVGVTETAGQMIAFYQRGVLMGGPTDAVDMNIYANEMWFKDYIGTQIMTMQLALPILAGNDDGRAKLMGILQDCCSVAKGNGTISPGKTLTTIQKQYITQITDNPDAWRQVQDLGSYYDIYFTTEVTTDGRTEYVANYTLVYSKSDQIRKVNGSNVLI